jgi:hypothetical protein
MERKVLNRWLALLCLVVAAFGGTVLTLNLTLYSASGFVGSYLHALARHDVDAVLATDGIELASAQSSRLTAADALGSLDDIRLVSDVAESNGTHTVTYRYRSGSTTGSSEFRVRHTGSRLGLFSAWRFDSSPVATLRITPQNADSFTANGVAITSSAGPSAPASYQVFVPAVVSLGHRSTYLSAPTTRVLVATVGGTKQAAIDIQANPIFVRQVQKELNTFLADCARQKVLLPTGCPMGTQITDRIQSAPVWSMVRYPKVVITPSDTVGSWQVPETPATAHLVVKVKSIFDGSVSTFDKDVPFTVRYLVSFQPDGSPLITAE